MEDGNGLKRQQTPSRLHAFCGNCGTPIYACAVDNPQSYGLRIGAITQRAAFSPKRQGWRPLRCIEWMRLLPCLRPRKSGWLNGVYFTQDPFV